jgi:sugar phosphate isomerase/epimerase
MKLGLFTPVFGSLKFPEMLRAVRALEHVQAIELGTGCWPGSAHLDLDELLADAGKAADFRRQIEDAGLAISALSCHGNPLHPDPAQGGADDAVFRKTIRLAERLGVGTMVTFSGCPGDHEGATRPNWVTAAWPPEFLDILEWQWAEKAVPYWTEASTFAANHGVKVALEAHPGFLVYNTDTALRLRAATTKNLGVNVDPSHLFWQGMDPVTVIRALGDAVFYVHAKDVALDPRNVAVNGVLDAKSYTRMAERSWVFRTVGWGHDELAWKQIVSALRLIGYDGVLSIEHEDALASVDEGLRSAVQMMSRVLLKESPAVPWWI